ncbi:MAG TPA: chromate resistance protein ChrB domain-containing protein [Gemmatimonadaceae bacterium]|nr:chromate resistance protein ChrB domain-containing protein [Gemmatimonadaceae bacterium]
MSWLVFSYSLPSTGRSSARVAVWRRLRALGAVSPKGGVHVLPERDECAEAFQWLVREVEQAKGEALLMRVERFEGLSDAQLSALFHDARKEDYAALDARIADVEKTLAGSRNREPTDSAALRESVARLRREYGDIARIDFFGSSAGAKVASRLLRVEQSLAPARTEQHAVASASIPSYRTRRWVTRPGPYVDRLACAWLIRRFINPDAVIRYSTTPEPDEVAFDMSEGEFSHRGNLCTFETMVLAFGLENPAMRVIAEIVHDIDLRDGRYVRPEVPGVDAILRGWMDRADTDREAHGIALFDGLHEAFSTALGGTQRTSRRGAARTKSAGRRGAR